MPFALHADNTAVAIAHAAHLLGDDDITLELLDTGVRGKGIHIGHLVPHLCREIGIPLTARYVPDNERISRSRRIADLAESSLAALASRHT